MSRSERFAASAIGIGLFGLVHAALTWPLSAVLAFFGGGAVISFGAEAMVINRGWLEHHIEPKAFGVPLYALFGWTGMIYIAYRLALLGTDGWIAVAVTAVLATTYDGLTDHRGVSQGYWTYTEDVSGPRYRGVPWWTFLGLVIIISLTAALAMQFL